MKLYDSAGACSSVAYPTLQRYLTRMSQRPAVQAELHAEGLLK